MHSYAGGGVFLASGIGMIIYSMCVWWRDVIRESTYQGHHTSAVQVGLRYGMILFIASEVMFFLAFFWAFFHSSLAPTVEIGAVWPPKGIQVLNPWEIPFLNTIILLSSGASVTWAHHAILAGYRKQGIAALAVTIALAVVFTGFQGYEYAEAPFTIADGVYGSTFYLATGFHGFHVIVGTLFLAVCLYSINFPSFYEETPLWLRSSRLVLAYGRRSVVVSICIHLLLGRCVAALLVTNLVFAPSITNSQPIENWL